MTRKVTLLRPIVIRGFQKGPGLIELSEADIQQCREHGVLGDDAAPEPTAAPASTAAPNPAQISTEKLLAVLKSRKVSLYLVNGEETEVPKVSEEAVATVQPTGIYLRTEAELGGLNQAAVAHYLAERGVEIPADANTKDAMVKLLAADIEKAPKVSEEATDVFSTKFGKWATQLAQSGITSIDALKAADVDKLPGLGNEDKAAIKAEVALLED